MPFPAPTPGGMTLHSYHSNTVIENLNRVGTPYTAGSFLNSFGSETIRGLTVRNCQFINEYWNGQHFKWGTRLYNLENSKWERVNIVGADKEHAFYNNIVGALSLKGCTFRDHGAQGVQIVNRRIEGNDKTSWMVPGVHRLEKQVIDKCGQERGQGRAAYALSMFGKQDDPYVENTGTFEDSTDAPKVGDTLQSSETGLLVKLTAINWSTKTWAGRTPMKTGPTTNGFIKSGESLAGPTGILHEITLVGHQDVQNGPRSRWDCPVELFQCDIVHQQTTPWELYGALMVEWRPYLHVVDGQTNYDGASSTDLWHIDFVDHVTVENHFFHGVKYVDIDHAKSVSLMGCTTDNGTKVRINGQVMGPVSNNILWSK